MALAMVSAGHERADVEDPEKDIAFPDSVISFFRGELGQPAGGFPSQLQEKVLKGEAPLTTRPGAVLPPLDLTAARADAETAIGREMSDEEFCSHLMYPQVFADYAAHEAEFGPVTALPTPVFFYGMSPGQEIAVEIQRGMTIFIRCLAIGDPNEEGMVKVFFELNGQPRTARVQNRSVESTVQRRAKADDGNPDHVAAPMPGVISTVAVSNGQQVEAGALLLRIEAMKMETAIHAEQAGTVSNISITTGDKVDAHDLLMEVG